MDMTEAYPGRDSAPAKSEVLWGCPETSVNGRSRFTRENGWEWWTGREWAPHPQDATLVYQELARRLLAERAEQEKLDDHNDKLEAEALIPPSRLYPDPIERRLVFLEKRDSAQIEENNDLKRRIAELDQNLAREVERVTDVGDVARVRHRHLDQQMATLRSMVEAQENVLRRLDSDVALLRDAALPSPGGPPADPPPPLSWDRTRGIMVNDQGETVLNLVDYREGENDLLEKLAALWCAWGEGGYLRDLLTQTRHSPVFMGTPGFRQLRSELLAKPWKEGA